MSDPIVLAFSGGLDTSFCIPFLSETLGRPVITVTVDTGGLDAAAREALAVRAHALGAAEHILVDARAAYFDKVLRFLVMGNVRRGQVYPLCVGAERVIQAQEVARAAARLGTRAVAHGCTAAGNDQVRFDVALRTLDPGLEVIAPVRDQPRPRAEQVAFLEERGLPVPSFGAAYSMNRGLWGVTIGGRETLGSAESIPESAWVLTRGAFDSSRSTERPAEHHTLGFIRGVPVSFDGAELAPPVLIERVEAAAAAFGIGRGIHLGETILGIKGRVAFEAPAAEVLINAHRELEKLTLTGRQIRMKETAAMVYGDLVHEGQHLDPVCRDIEALLLSSQERVTGTVKLLFRTGQVFVEGIVSPHSLLAATQGIYGESAGEWTAADARGFSRIAALPGMLHARASGRPAMNVFMKSIVLDKIASVTRSCQLKREVRASSEIPCEEGVVIAVRVLTDKSTYNQLELPSGRMAQVKRGDVVAGALGHRHALFGYAGHLPETLAPGDTVHLLNMGGVLGICDSVSPDLGPPFACEVLGAVLHFPYLGERIGVAARIGGETKLGEAPRLETAGVPVAALVGSCMNCGKTAAACALIRELTHLDGGSLTVDGFKATGVSLRRDVLAMEDAGARKTGLFTDLGVVSTTDANAAAVTRTLLTTLAAGKPDAIVAELGDGLLGAYGVAAILDDAEIRAAFTAVVLAANDPVAAWGGVRLLRERYGIEPVAVTGPATDNLAGTRIIEEQLGVPAINARLNAPRLAALVRERMMGVAQ